MTIIIQYNEINLSFIFIYYNMLFTNITCLVFYIYIYAYIIFSWSNITVSSSFTPSSGCESTPVLYNNSMYAFGGIRNEATGSPFPPTFADSVFINQNILVLTLNDTVKSSYAVKSSDIAPLNRTLSGFTFNPVTDEMIMFGGYTLNTSASTLARGTGYFNDLWAFSPNLGTWRLLQDASSGISASRPIGRNGPNFVTIKQNGFSYGLLFSGYGTVNVPYSLDDSALNDMWLLNFTSMADVNNPIIWRNVSISNCI